MRPICSIYENDGVMVILTQAAKLLGSAISLKTIGLYITTQQHLRPYLPTLVSTRIPNNMRKKRSDNNACHTQDYAFMLVRRFSHSTEQ